MRKLIALAVLAMLAASPAKACYLNTCEANADNPWRQAPPQQDWPTPPPMQIHPYPEPGSDYNQRLNELERR